MVFGHYPTYANGSAGQHGQWFVRRQLEHLIRQCHVQVYFAGHVHHQTHLDFGFYQEIIQGACTAKLTTVQPGDPQQRFGAATQGFAWVQVTAERLVVRFYDLQQTVMHAFIPLASPT